MFLQKIISRLVAKDHATCADTEDSQQLLIKNQWNYSTFKADKPDIKMKIKPPPYYWPKYSDILALIFLVLLIWAIGYALFGDEIVGINSQLFRLCVLFISAKVFGVLVGFIRIPPMVGMLVMGILLRNVDFIELRGGYIRFAALLRQMALVNIMLPAGLGLDAKVLLNMVGMILGLSIVPVAVEVAGITVMAHYLLAFPWLWGLLLGILLAAVSPAVIIPCLFELQRRGFGTDKGVHTLVIAASTINDIICVALFGVFIGVIFSTGSLTMQILQGPIVFALGITYGIFWGIVCIYLPSKHEKYLVTLRTLLLGLGSVLSSFGSEAIGYAGAGALGAIVAAFVASYGWKKQGWTSQNPVRANFVLLWKFFEPISFGLIGMEVNFGILNLETVSWGILVMTVPLIARCVTSYFITRPSHFNFKENIFIALSWISKATVQAALGPVALDMVRNTDNEELEGYAHDVVVIAVISIILTSPIGAVLIMELGPKFLNYTPPQGPENPETVANQDDEERL